MEPPLTNDLRNHKFYRLIYDMVANHPYKDDLNALHGSIIVRGGSVLSIGLNEPKKCGFSQYYATHNGFVCHSELVAIKKIRRKIDLTGCCMYNLRLDKNGKIKISKPCVGCEAMLADYSFKKVYYSTDAGDVEMMKFSNLKIGEAA